MSRENKGYARKAAEGRVPHVYQIGSRSFEEGAWKNWPAEVRDDEAARMALALRDLPRRETWHRFTDGQ